MHPQLVFLQTSLEQKTCAIRSLGSRTNFARFKGCCKPLCALPDILKDKSSSNSSPFLKLSSLSEGSRAGWQEGSPAADGPLRGPSVTVRMLLKT